MTEQEERDRIAFALDALLAICAVELAVQERHEATTRALAQRQPTPVRISADWLRKAS